MHYNIPPESPPSRVLGLARLSRGKDDQPGNLSQAETITGWWDAEGWGQAGRLIITEGASGWRQRKIILPDGEVTYQTFRPKFAQAVKMLRTGNWNGFSVVTCDRGMRNNEDLKILEDIVRTSCPGKFAPPRIQCLSVDGSFDLRTEQGISKTKDNVENARQQSAATSRRINDKFLRWAKDGVHFGSGQRRGYQICDPGTKSIPCPECNGGKLRVDEEEAAKILMAAQGILDNWTWDRIMEEGRKMPGEWDMAYVRQALLSPVIAGRSWHQGIDVGKGRWKPILDLPIWNRVGAIILDQKRTKNKPGGRRITRLGSGLFRCSIPGCDGRMGYQVQRGDLMNPESYSCQECHGQRRRAEIVDRIVSDAVKKRLARTDAKDLLRRTRPDRSAEIAGLGEEIRRLERAIVIANAVFHEAGDEPGIEAAAGVIAKTALKLNARRAELEELSLPDSDPDPEGMFSNKNASRIWDRLTTERKREIIGEIAQVWVGPATRKGSRLKSIPSDEKNIEVKFWELDGTFPDRPVNEPYATDTERVREILEEMFAERDAWLIRDVTARVHESGLGVSYKLIQSARRELGLITDQDAWARPGASLDGLPPVRPKRRTGAPRICEREGCGREFQPYNSNQRCCSSACSGIRYMTAHPRAHGKRIGA
jgi:hypothetical protein